MFTIEVLARITKTCPAQAQHLFIQPFCSVFHGLLINAEAAPMISSIDRILKDGGKVAMIEFQKKETKMGPPLAHRFSPAELQESLEGIGLKLSRTLEISDHHYLALFVR